MKRSRSGVNFFSRYRDLLIVLLLVAAPIVFYLANSKEPRDHNFIDRALVSLSAPVQWLLITTVGGVADTWQHYVALIHVEETNRELRRDNRALRRELVIRREQALENHRLRRLLYLQEQSSELTGVVAEVVAMSPSPLYRSVRISRGSDHGVVVGAGVVDDIGVVGRVVGVSSKWADVMLLVDGNCSTDVLVQRTRVQARVRGEGQDREASLQVEYLERTADVEPGDILITSGLGEIFPRGIEVGQVTVVKRGRYGLYQSVELKPATNFMQLETVMVLVREEEALPVLASPPYSLIRYPRLGSEPGASVNEVPFP